MEASQNRICPRCGEATLTVYYEEGTDSKLGARCASCDLKAYFLGEALVPIRA